MATQANFSSLLLTPFTVTHPSKVKGKYPTPHTKISITPFSFHSNTLNLTLTLSFSLTPKSSAPPSPTHHRLLSPPPEQASAPSLPQEDHHPHSILVHPLLHDLIFGQSRKSTFPSLATIDRHCRRRHHRSPPPCRRHLHHHSRSSPPSPLSSSFLQCFQVGLAQPWSISTCMAYREEKHECLTLMMKYMNLHA